MTAYLVTYEQIITLKNNHTNITNFRRTFVVANSSDEAISLIENFLKLDEKTSKGIISHDNFVASLCSTGDMLLDNGTYVNEDGIWYEGG